MAAPPGPGYNPFDCEDLPKFDIYTDFTAQSVVELVSAGDEATAEAVMALQPPELAPPGKPQHDANF